MVEPEALGDRARELVVGERAVLDQQPLGQRARVLRARDGLVHHPLLDEAEVDDDVGQHAAGPAAP